MAERKFLAKILAQAGLKLPTGAVTGHVLTSDSEGNATWQASGGGAGGTELGFGDPVSQGELAFNTPYTPNADHPTWVTASVRWEDDEQEWKAVVLVNGIEIGQGYIKNVRGPAEGWTFDFPVPAAGTWEIQLSGETAGVTLPVVTYVEITGGGTPGPTGATGPAGSGTLLTFTAKSAEYTAVSGDYVLMSGAHTVNLPSPTAGRVVGVESVNGTGAAPCTVKAGSGEIKGPGVKASATSILLGAERAHVTLEADGTNWHIIAGEQDSGWLEPGLENGWKTYISVGYRLTGNTVRLRGTVIPGASEKTIFTLPAGYRQVNEGAYQIAAGEIKDAAILTITAAGALVPIYLALTSASFDSITFTVD